jgi:tetratricopeptide (TPR) repeat protein
MKTYQYFWKTVFPTTAIAFASTFAIALAFSGCQSASNNTKTINLSILDAATIYADGSVRDFVFAMEESNTSEQKDASKRDFLKAIDLKVNQKNPTEAVHYFRKSICMFPEANAYYELSDALISLKQYEEAANALRMAEVLRFTPLANLYFRQAQVLALQEQGEYSVAENLRKAVEQGFADKAAIENEPSFASLQKTEQFQRLYLDKFTQVQDKETAEFRMFLAGFPVSENGYEIKADDIEQINTKYINYDFAKYVKEMETRQDFGREVGSEYFYAAKVQETSQYVAVVYIAKDAVAEVIPPIFASLVTYDLKGKEIDKIAFACQCDYKTVKTGKIAGNQVTVTQHNREWEAEFTEVAPSENKIKSVTEISKESYTIAANGKIESANKTTGMLLKHANLLAVK